mgnify:CR=1 FL=1
MYGNSGPYVDPTIVSFWPKIVILSVIWPSVQYGDSLRVALEIGILFSHVLSAYDTTFCTPRICLPRLLRCKCKEGSMQDYKVQANKSHMLKFSDAIK